ncbi:hypothetical protein MCOR06_000375 [Pyricularia oryzae]|nr:hypothetical protein MCOR06_000375 [Pyricularia oryzae]
MNLALDASKAELAWGFKLGLLEAGQAGCQFIPLYPGQDPIWELSGVVAARAASLQRSKMHVRLQELQRQIDMGRLACVKTSFPGTPTVADFRVIALE